MHNRSRKTLHHPSPRPSTISTNRNLNTAQQRELRSSLSTHSKFRQREPANDTPAQVSAKKPKLSDYKNKLKEIENRLLRDRNEESK